MQVLQRSFSRTSELLARGQVASVQGLAYPFSGAVTALRQFAHVRHVGKILLHLEPAAIPGGAIAQAQVMMLKVDGPLQCRLHGCSYVSVARLASSQCTL